MADLLGPDGNPLAQGAPATRLSAFGRSPLDSTGEQLAQQHREARKAAAQNRRLASVSANNGTGGPSMRMATGRPTDPDWYFREHALPYDPEKPDELAELRKVCRIIALVNPVIGSAISIYCLAGETKVLTDEGSKRIDSLAGEVTRVITKGGRWVDAKFDCMGVDHLRKITLGRYGATKVIYATPSHRWYIEKFKYPKGRSSDRREATTDELKPGDALATVTPYVNSLKRSHPSPFGVAHGFVVGDGTRDDIGGCYADLHGEKDLAVLSYFNGASTTIVDMADGPTTRVHQLPGYFKELPSLQESASYLAGWLAGYFLADGTVKLDGRDRQKVQCFIDSSDLANVELARDICTRLGIFTYPIASGEKTSVLPDGVERTITMYSLNIDPFDLCAEFFIGEEHRRRWEECVGGRDRDIRRANWKVVSVDETDRFEPVYCAVVPDTESFVLEDFILTGNSRYPFTGMELVSSDPAIKRFYDEVFLEDGLDYEEFATDIAREYFTVGEAFPFGSFNESLGVWEDDELLNPDGIEVIESPMFLEPRFEMELPESLRKVLTERKPEWEYETLIRSYPELAEYAQDPSKKMPVSSVLLRQIKHKMDAFNPRGIPLLYRALRSVVQEEMLNSAQDAIASRLYTPLILARLGASATDLGTNSPWIPDEGDLAAFEESLDMALAADFRVLTHHFAVQMENVFGREQMPRLEQDFDRLTEKQLQVFGLSKTMLSGGSGNQTYAADALNRDLITQLLRSIQRLVKRQFRHRALVVAEAQEHFEYYIKGGRRMPVMEEVLEVNEYGDEVIVERPKLMVPDMEVRAMNLKDDEQLRQFYEALRAGGVPISDETRLVNVPVDIEDEYEKSKRESVRKALEEQRVRQEIYMTLKEEGLPIPDDIAKDFNPQAIEQRQEESQQMASAEQPGDVVPLLGYDDASTTQNLAPTPDDIARSNQADPDVNEGVSRLPRNKLMERVEGDRPAESDEQRADMPKPASMIREAFQSGDPDAFREAIDQADESGAHYRVLTEGPFHVGMRRVVTAKMLEDEWNDDDDADFGSDDFFDADEVSGVAEGY